jgi:long-chain acyl-CoA synthetase
MGSYSKWNKYLELTRHQNLAKMVLSTINKYGSNMVMRWFAEDLESVHQLTYNELGELMRAMYGGLAQFGLKKSDRIALCCETRAEWVYCDLGVQSLGGTLVAIYPNLKSAEVKYILNDSGSRAIIVDSPLNLAKVLQIRPECPTVERIIIIEHLDEEKRTLYKKDPVYELSEVLDLGRQYNQSQPDAFNRSVDAVQEDDLASLIYTSGTTGVPKGTMLTQRNFLSDATMSVGVAATLRPHIKPFEINFFTLLPLAHSFGRCVDEYCVLYCGACMNFVGGYDPKRVRKAFEVFQPTLMAAIPYFFQKIYNIIMDVVDHMKPKLQKVFRMAVENSKIYYGNKRDGKPVPLKVAFIQNTVGKLVGRVVRKKLGGKILLMISGSAAISPELVLFFYGFGIILAEGFGLTETSPVTHLLRGKDNSDFRPNFHKKVDIYQKLGTVGPLVEIPDNPYENPEQKLSDIGELLLKGPMVMKGYWNQPQETADALDKDGWLHTGDLAEIDEDGYVRITGRAKVVIKLQTAKMISPVAVEKLIVPTSKLIAQIILYGDDTRKYITAIVVPYQAPLKQYADEHGIPYKTWSDLLHHPKILNLIKADIVDRTKDVSEFALPKKYAISSAAFEMKEGYLTPSYKFKRKKLFDDLKEDINKLYAQEEEFYILENRMTGFYDQSAIIS